MVHHHYSSNGTHCACGHLDALHQARAATDALDARKAGLCGFTAHLPFHLSAHHEAAEAGPVQGQFLQTSFMERGGNHSACGYSIYRCAQKCGRLGVRPHRPYCLCDSHYGSGKVVQAL